ncbi:MAG: ChbG/HpnK family deacetylase [Gemmatimonadota bacterium]|nr:ChbG/HpnK family deacetylase [Gemmatimonadota bacterium]
MGSTTDPRRLIINADDYGISRGVSIGIIEAAEAGAVTSASMIVNLEAFADAAERARSTCTLSLGLHLNLTTGHSITPAASLTRGSSRQFYSLPVLIARASLGLIDASDVSEECVAQIDRMIGAGFHPTHVDSHRHVHAHPMLRPAVSQAAASRGVSNVRVPSEPLWTRSRDWRAALKQTALLICGRISRRSPSEGAANHFFGISLQSGGSFAARLFALIPHLPAGTSELMTHPGHPDQELAEHDDYPGQREEELGVLCSREFRDLLVRCGIQLASFGRAPRIARQGEVTQHD